MVVGAVLEMVRPVLCRRSALRGYKDKKIKRLNEQSKTAWSEVLNQYQRQALDTARCAPRTLTWRSAFWLASADARPREEGR